MKSWQASEGCMLLQYGKQRSPGMLTMARSIYPFMLREAQAGRTRLPERAIRCGLPPHPARRPILVTCSPGGTTLPC